MRKSPKNREKSTKNPINKDDRTKNPKQSARILIKENCRSFLVRTGDFADDIRTYIDLHIKDEITIEDLCAASQKSPNQTIRLFKQKIRRYAASIYFKIKFTAACTMLQSSNLSVGKITARLNYQSVGYFSNFFHSFNGMRPSEYRRLYRRSVKQT